MELSRLKKTANNKYVLRAYKDEKEYSDEVPNAQNISLLELRGDFTLKYENGKIAEAEAVSPQTVDAIIEVNNGSMTLAQLVADMKELLKAEGAAGLKMTEEQVDALAADLGSRTFCHKVF